MFFFIATIGLTSMQSVTKIDPSGTWDYEVETAQGTMTGIMTIEKSDATYKVKIETTQFGTLDLENTKLEKNELTANLDMQGAVIDFKFEFDGDSMKGTVSTPDGDMDMTGKKRKK
ncbi:hypothetical protein [Polaribacter uvawellassae]|uniref:hypothetical protein n=1 Tax=Polaribacter uvawellassae TaxID=3133495 RepID=UPI00321B714A